MSRYSKKAQRHAKASRKRTQRMLGQAASRSGPVTISYLPGFEPPVTTSSAPTKFPFTAIINGRKATVTREEITYDQSG